MKTVKVVCSQCGLAFDRLKKQQDFAVKEGTKKFLCSRKCQSASQRNGKYVPCSVCGKQVYKNLSRLGYSDSGLMFCSKSCANGFNNEQRSGENHPLWTNGLGSYRDRALKHYGANCTICGYSIEAVLEVHHRDGNREHNSIENLDVLCPTHHEEFEVGIRTY
jgi:hypothetical protein